jgi:hypothetical protein
MAASNVDASMQAPAKKRSRVQHPPPPIAEAVPMPDPAPPIQPADQPFAAAAPAQWLPRIRLRNAAELTLAELAADTNTSFFDDNAFRMDCDKLIMQITPSCLHLFAKHWEVGGSALRGLDDKGFPEGLELAFVSPWTLRIRSSAYPALDAHHLAVLREWGAAICLNLRTAGSRKPVLLPPADPAMASKQLARHQKCCEAIDLMRAINAVPGYADMELYVCRYGMKLEAEPFFSNVLGPALDQMVDELGRNLAWNIWDNKIIDWALEGKFNAGNIPLVFPKGTVHSLHWVRRTRQKASTFSSFGELGGGYGGFVLDGAPDTSIQKVKVYTGGWYHILSAIGMPPGQPPVDAKNQFYHNIKSKIADLVDSVASVGDESLVTLRCEITEGPGGMQDQEWEQLRGNHRGKLKDLSEFLWVREIPAFQAKLQLQDAFRAADVAGSFSYRSALLYQPATQIKRHDYCRLLHIMGISNKYTHKRAYKACKLQYPWGTSPPGKDWSDDEEPPPHVGHDAAALHVALDALVSNPILPAGTPMIYIETAMTPGEVKQLGLRRGPAIDWTSLATHLGHPVLAAFLLDVCQQTIWRRSYGRASGSHKPFAATARGGSVLSNIGVDLVTATINLVVDQQQNNVNRHDAA